MDASLRLTGTTASRAIRATAVALFHVLSLSAVLVLAWREAASLPAWRELLADGQTVRAIALSVWTACASTVLALVAAMAVVAHAHGTPAWRRVTASLGPMLAVPHAAFAIGLALLVMPAGLAARLLAPLAGWDAPPPWATVNDRHGLALVVALALKELPFLLWTMVALLARPDVAETVERQVAAGRTLGHSRPALWWKALWPLWLPRLGWPVLAVFAYSMSVVDVALVIGPGAPPTLAVLAWQWLTDASRARNAQGAAAAWLLLAALAVLSLLALAAWRVCSAAWRAHVLRGHDPESGDRAAGASATRRFVVPVLRVVPGMYGAVLAMLAFVSASGVWSFPSLLPQQWSAAAWQQVAQSLPVLGLSAALGLAASVGAAALAIAWLESTPPRWDMAALPLIVLPLVLPSLLLAAGLHRVALALGLDGTFGGLWWAHTLMASPYVLIALAPAWRSFDRRYEWTALALGRSRTAFWWRVKLPMLAAPLAAALAVGFAVSVAQYLPTQFVGAGRHATVTTEAVTLAAGGQRQHAAAWALLQALLPAAGFAAAWAVARAGRRHRA